MKQRTVTGLLAAALLVALIYFGTPLILLGVICVAVIWAYSELDKLLFEEPAPLRRFRLWILLCLGCIAFAQNDAMGWIFQWVAFVFLVVWHLGIALRAEDVKQMRLDLRNFTFEWLAFVYTSSFFIFLVPIARVGREYLFHLFFLVFMGDTGAYFVGKKWGIHKLAPKLSPKKTIEGAIGAIVFTCLASVVWAFVIARKGHIPSFLIAVVAFSAVASVLAQLGDLFESLIKRTHAVKDSGQFLPGHGGMLDRIDSLALVAPLYYVFVKVLVAYT